MRKHRAELQNFIELLYTLMEIELLNNFGIGIAILLFFNMACADMKKVSGSLGNDF